MIETINRWLGWFCAAISGCAIILMALVAFVDSIGRQLNRPLQGADEYVSFALLTFFFASLPIVVRDDAHIRVGLFGDLYKPRLARIEKYFTAIVEVVALGAIGWMIFDQADRLARFGTLSVFFELPMAPWVYFAGILCVVAVWFAVQEVWRIHANPRPRPHAIPDEEI